MGCMRSRRAQQQWSAAPRVVFVEEAEGVVEELRRDGVDAKLLKRVLGRVWRRSEKVLCCEYARRAGRCGRERGEEELQGFRDGCGDIYTSCVVIPDEERKRSNEDFNSSLSTRRHSHIHCAAQRASTSETDAYRPRAQQHGI